MTLHSQHSFSERHTALWYSKPLVKHYAIALVFSYLAFYLQFSSLDILNEVNFSSTSFHLARNTYIPRLEALLPKHAPLLPHSLPPDRLNTTKPRVSFESRGLSCKMAATYSPAGVQYHRRGRA